MLFRICRSKKKITHCYLITIKQKQHETAKIRINHTKNVEVNE